MNRVGKYLLQYLSFFLTMVSSSCEEIDVCDQPVSPRLKIIFKNSQGNALILDNLYVYRDDNKKSEIQFSKVDSLDIALNVNNNITCLEFSRVKGEYQGSILIEAEAERQYVSIACGFKRLYKNVIYKLHSSPKGIKRKIALQNRIFDEKQPHLELIW